MIIIDFILHIDTHLIALTAQYGIYIYGILFTIVFLETGVVFFPFLPGDSLLFAAGAFAAQGALDPWLLTILFLCAAIFGDAVNFSIGSLVGKKCKKKDGYLRMQWKKQNPFFIDMVQKLL